MTIDINSRQELEQLAKEENLDIDFNEYWKIFDKIVQQGKENIKQALIEHHKKPYINKVFVFDIKKQKVINVFQNPKDCGKYYNIKPEQVCIYLRTHKPYLKQMVEFRKNG